MDRMHFLDESGKRLELELMELLEAGGDEYALFATPADQLAENEEPQFYVLHVEYKNGERDTFSMPTEEQMELVMPAVQQLLSEKSGCGGGCSGCSGCGHSH